MKKKNVIKKIDSIFEKINEKTARFDKYSKKIDKNGSKYRGTNNITKNGITCQYWTKNYKNNNKFIDLAKKKKLGLGNHNYCRNPDTKNKKDIWCYTKLG